MKSLKDMTTEERVARAKTLSKMIMSGTSCRSKMELVCVSPDGLFFLMHHKSHPECFDCGAGSVTCKSWRGLYRTSCLSYRDQDPVNIWEGRWNNERQSEYKRLIAILNPKSGPMGDDL